MSRRLQMFYLTLFAGIGSLYPLLPLHLQKIGLTGTKLGLLLASGPIAAMLVQPVWGILTDKFQAQRSILIIALLVSGTSGFMLQFATSYSTVMALFVVTTLFQSAIVPISDALSVAHMKSEGLDFGLVRLWGSIGFAVAVWVSGLLTQIWGPQMMFYLYLAMFVVTLFLVRGLPRNQAVLTGRIGAGIKTLLKNPRYLLFVVASFMIFGPMNANNSYFSIFFSSIGGTVAGVGTAFLLFAGSEVPFMRISGAISQRFGITIILLFAAIMSTLRWYFYSMAPSGTWVLSLFFIQGLSIGLFLPVAANYIRSVAPAEVQVTAQSVYAAFGNAMGTTVTSFIAGWMLDRYGIFHVYNYFAISSLIGAVIFLILGLMRNPREN